MTRRKRTFDERRAILQAVEYEVSMLVAIAHGIASGVAAKSVLGNAMVESFALHARNLIDFIWPDGARSDHVLAEDFLPGPKGWAQQRPPITDLLKASRIRAHKEIAHLSYDRLQVTEDKKAWFFVQIANEILEAYRTFVALLPPEYRTSGNDSPP